MSSEVHLICDVCKASAFDRRSGKFASPTPDKETYDWVDLQLWFGDDTKNVEWELCPGCAKKVLRAIQNIAREAERLEPRD